MSEFSTAKPHTTVSALHSEAVALLEKWQYPEKGDKPSLQAIIDHPLLAQAALIKDGGGDTLLHTALASKAFGLVHALARVPAAINIPNDYGLPPLLHAIHLGHLQAAEMLLDRGADASYSMANGTNALHVLAKLKMPPHDMNAYARQHMDLRPSIAGTRTAAAVAKNELTSSLTSKLILHGADAVARAPYTPPQPEGTSYSEHLARVELCIPSEIAQYAGNKALAKQLQPSATDFQHHEWIESFRQACRENRVEAAGDKLSVPQLLKEGLERRWASVSVLNEAQAIAARGNRLEGGKTSDGRNEHSFHRLGAIIHHAQEMLAAQSATPHR